MSNYRLEGQSWTAQPITWDFAASTLPQDQAGAPFSNLITQQDAQAVVASAFEAWSQVAGVQFVYAPQDSAAVDIRIGWGTFGPASGGSDTIGETTYHYDSATNRFVPDVVIQLLDPAQDPYSDASGTPTYADGLTLSQITLHEIGHALGLAHDTIDANAIMYPYASTGNTQLTLVDMQGLQAIYGVPQAVVTDIGDNQETVSGTLSGPPATVFGSDGALDYAGGIGLIVLGGGSARVHGGTVTVFAGGGPLAASANQDGTFILGSGYASIAGGVAGSRDVVFGGSGGFTYAGAQEAASVVGGTGSATITGGAAGGYYGGGSDGDNSLTARGIGTVLVGGGGNDTLLAAAGGYDYLVAGAGNQTLRGAGGGTDRFFLGSGSDAVSLGTGQSQLLTGLGTATISGGGGSSALFGGSGGADLYVQQAGSSMAITGFREGTDQIGGGAPTAIAVAGGNTVLRFGDGATITLNGLTDPTGTGLFG